MNFKTFMKYFVHWSKSSLSQLALYDVVIIKFTNFAHNIIHVDTDFLRQF